MKKISWLLCFSSNNFLSLFYQNLLHLDTNFESKGKHCNKKFCFITAPDNIVMSILSVRLSQLDCVSRGWVLHGFPRTREQAETLTKDGFVPNRYAYWGV